MSIIHLTNNTKLFFGDSIPKYLTKNVFDENDSRKIIK